MKRIFFIFFGAATFGSITYFSIGIFGSWYEHNVAQSEHDLGLAYLWFLGVLALSILAGGVFGHWVHHRNLTNKDRS